MATRVVKLVGLAAVAGGGYFLYNEWYATPQREANLQKAGAVADDRLVHLGNKAKEAEQGATATVFQAKEQIQQAASSAASSFSDKAASLTDKASKGVDNSAAESKGALASVKGWFTGK